MKILVLGATGATGREVVDESLQQGHAVTVLVRHPEKLAESKKALRVLVGDVADGSPGLSDAVVDQDAVVSTLGVGKSFSSGGLIERSAPLLIRAMASRGVSRLIFLSACGVGRTMKNVPTLPRFLMGLLLRNIFADKQAGEEHIVRSDLNWTIVYPVMLTNGPKTGRYRAAEQLELHGFPTVSRSDVAHFLVRQLRASEYCRKGVIVSL
jgi:putative NADH-flavin reductase